MQLALAVAAAVALAGCGAFFAVSDQDPPFRPRYHPLVLPGFGDLAQVEFQVSDTTESTTGSEIDGRQPPVQGLDSGFVAAVPGRPNAIVVGWAGGCEDTGAIAIEGVAGERPQLTLKLVWQAEDCPQRDVPRRVVIVFEQPVDPARFFFHVVQ